MLQNNDDIDDDTAAAYDDDDANELTPPRAFTRSSMCLGQFLTLPPTSGEQCSLSPSIPQFLNVRQPFANLWGRLI